MSSSTASSVTVDGMLPSDRPAVERIARNCGGFTDAEVEVCLSLLGLPGEYEYAVARVNGETAGFLIYGTDPLAQGVWEVYWIATDGTHQRGGIGSALMRHMEQRVMGRGRMVLIETSGQSAYAHQRGFYEKNGYREAARIRDFYKPGDDLVIYRKDVAGQL